MTAVRNLTPKMQAEDAQRVQNVIGLRVDWAGRLGRQAGACARRWRADAAAACRATAQGTMRAWAWHAFGPAQRMPSAPQAQDCLSAKPKGVLWWDEG
eukprot:5078538-Prymnesium_polylepis.1